MKQNIINRVVLLVSLVCVISSCVQEIPENVVKDINENVTEGTTYLCSLKATVADFKNVTMADEFPSTKTDISIDEGGNYQLVWADTDTIGIFPSSGMQVAFPMASSAGSKNATFDGGGWGLKTSAIYSAYFPLIGQFYLDRTKIPMIVSTQVQKGNGSFSHVGKYDYMAAVNSVVNEQGGVEFNFSHLVSILHMQIKMPKGGKYSYVAIECSGKFTTEATINLADGTVVPTKQSPIQIMRLENVELDSGEENPILEIWIVIHPVDLSGKMLYTKVFDENNNCYTTTMQAKNFEAGTIYNSRKIATEDMTHTGLPVVIINTPENVDITSKEEYVEDALMTILQTDITDAFCELTNMKGRGNSTWNAPKKPYAIKFNKKKSLISLPEDKQWVLLANYYDKTLLRNSVALYMGNEMSTLAWTPHYQYVDLMLNGQYRGIYQLGEKVKVSKKRVNVGDDGFLVEIDWRCKTEDDARFFYLNQIGSPINIKEPEVEYDDNDFNYIKNKLLNIEGVLYSDDYQDTENGWQKYMDMDSFVDWYIINELAKNADAKFGTSCYMHCKRDGKLYMGPIWDFDLGFGGFPNNDFYQSPEGFHIKNATWFTRLFTDPLFEARVKERFSYYYTNRQNIYDYIDEKYDVLADKIVEENRLWGRLSSTSTEEEVAKSQYQQEVNSLKSWIESRFEWLKENLNVE